MNLHDHRAMLLADILEQQADRSANFWDYVDNGHPDRHETWAQDRAGCLSITTMGYRCTKAPIAILPFCTTHADRAERWIEAVMIGRLRSRLNSELSHYETLEADAPRVIRQAIDVLFSHGSSCVYFYELRGQGVVKIGTSANVTNRIASFRNGKGCTFPAGADHTTGHLIGTTPGGPALEKQLHGAYRHLRVVGEWFRLTDELADDIADLISRSPAEEAA